MNKDLAFALELADLADAITLERFRAADLVVDTKPDMTPVSEADRAAELVLRKRIGEERPHDGIVGEELGAEGSERARWILDPIDGTKNYVRGIPVFGTLIALQRDGQVVCGVVSAPALRRRWWAARGEGAFADGQPIHVSGVRQLGDAQVCHASIEAWQRHGRAERFQALATSCWRTRGFGDFWMHMLVAEGAADVAAEPEVAMWDVAPLGIIVEEAGGRFSDLAGTPDLAGGSAISTNGLLHDQVLTTLRP